MKGMAAEVKQAFLNRPHLVDGAGKVSGVICADWWKRVGADLSAQSCSEAVIGIDGM